MRTGWPHISKPARGARIDWTSPLARGLLALYAINECGGTLLYDATGALPALTTSSGVAWGGTTAGAAVVSSSTTQSISALLPAALRPQYPIAMAVGYADPTANNNTAPFALTVNNTGAAPIASAAVQYNSVGQFVPGYISGGGAWSSGSPFTPPASGAHVLAGNWVGGALAMYLDGTRQTNDAVSLASSIPYTSTTTLGLSCFPGYSFGASQSSIWLALWSRALSASEHAAIGSSPNGIWRLIDPGPLRSWVFFQGAGVLLGSSSGGAIVGGSAAPSVAFAPAARGGPVAGGSASPSAVFTPSAAGGPVVGGAASGTGNTVFTATAAGGAVLGGLASPSAVFSGTSGGGAVLGGSAQGSANNVFTAGASGGAIVGGLAAPSAAFAGSSSGGVLAGGSAAASAVFSFTAAGGPIVGGAAAGYIPTTFVLYVDPRLVALLPEDGNLGDIDPTGAAVLSDDASAAGIDPTQVQIIQ